MEKTVTYVKSFINDNIRIESLLSNMYELEVRQFLCSKTIPLAYYQLDCQNILQVFRATTLSPVLHILQRADCARCLESELVLPL